MPTAIHFLRKPALCFSNPAVNKRLVDREHGYTWRTKGRFWASKEDVKWYEKYKMEKRNLTVCREFGLVKSTSQTICKNNQIVISPEKKSRIKRFRKPERNSVDEALLHVLSKRQVRQCTRERSSSHGNFCSSQV